MEEGESISFRDLVRARVFDSEGRHIGHVQDMAMEMDTKVSSPIMGHLGVHLLWTDRVGPVELVRRVEDIVILLPWSIVDSIGEDEVRLSEAHPALTAESVAGKRLVRRDVLDKQMLDSKGNRIQRVDDVLMKFEEGALKVVGLEVSRGLLLTSSNLRSYIAGLRRRHGSGKDSDVIPWEAVERIEREAVVIEDAVE